MNETERSLYLAIERGWLDDLFKRIKEFFIPTVKERWVLGTGGKSETNCPKCREFADMGEKPLGFFPMQRAETTYCGPDCTCSFEYSDGKKHEISRVAKWDVWEKSFMTDITREGQGKGNWGHKGRPGEVGGSAGSSSSSSTSEPKLPAKLIVPGSAYGPEVDTSKDWPPSKVATGDFKKALKQDFERMGFVGSNADEVFEIWQSQIHESEQVHVHSNGSWIRFTQPSGSDKPIIISHGDNHKKDVNKLYEESEKVNRSHNDLTDDDAAFILANYAANPDRTFFIHRNQDNRYRWFAWPACTAFINRDREIDSMALFDKFIEHIERTQEWPYLTFFHQGERFRLGDADFVARDGVAYLVSGLFDESKIATEIIQGIERSETGYWGTSINYKPIGQPYFIKEQGKNIPVYYDGIHKEVSLLPEFAASSIFTAFPIIKE